MNYLILTDCFYPENKSASRHIYDLACELYNNKNNITIIYPAYNNEIFYDKRFETKIIKLSDFKKLNFFIRGIFELFLPFQFLSKISQMKNNVDKIIVYSPSIFFGLIFNILKKKFNCKIILLLRDVFPDWAKQIGIFKNFSFAFLFLKFIAKFQYRNADIICLQSKKDFKIINNFYKFTTKKIILYNWIKINNICKIKNKKLNKIKKFVFAGTIGPVQNWENIIYAVKTVNKINQNIKFYFIGNGSLKNKIKKLTTNCRNLKFIDTLNEKKFLDFLSNCDAGILSLNKKIIFDNFPGKFFSYMETNLPVIADINKKHELTYLIKKNNIGLCNDPDDKEKLVQNILYLYKKLNNKKYEVEIRKQYKRLIATKFSSKYAANKIINI